MRVPHLNYFRGFDPAAGRYVASDPVGLHAGGATTFFTGQNLQVRSMKNRFKLEAWVMMLIPIVILLVGLLAAIAFGMLGSRH